MRQEVASSAQGNLDSFRNDLLDFTIDGEATDASLREDQIIIDEDIELPGPTGLYFDISAEAGLERIGQTGRASPVASRHAVKNLDCHSQSVALRLDRVQR